MRLTEEFINYLLELRNLFATVMATKNVVVDLHRAAWYKLCKNFEDAAATRAWLELPVDDVEYFLAADTLDTYESIIFDATVAWLRHDWEERRQWFVRLMRQICFAYMTTEELISCSQREPTFEHDDDALQLLTNANL